MMGRMSARPSLDGERFDVVVIGGGVNGVAIARECARAGRRTLLLEQNDFAAGVTSRSTRIIHGGLRYLEHGEIRMVREALRERERLLHEHPHLVRPMQFLLPVSRGSRRSAMELRFGLWLYDKLAPSGAKLPSSKNQMARLEALLDSGQRWTVLDCEDAQCEFPERLVAEWLVEAARAGAVVRNHAQVLAVEVQNGRARKVVFRDWLDGGESRVTSAWIVNATGPWADRICQRSNINTQHPMIGGVRGAHIVVPRFNSAPDVAVYTEADDGRPVFFIPWQGQLLVGSTEVPDSGDPAETRPSEAEVDYLLRGLRRVFPGCGVSAPDIVYAFAGVRPLAYSPNKPQAAVTRRHFLHDHKEDGAAGLLSVIGGKLTTAISLARDCARRIGVAVVEHPILAVAMPPADGIESTLSQWAAHVSSVLGISDSAARAIAAWHGSRALSVARLAQRDERMRATLCPHSDHIVAEAMDAVLHEFAVTLGDMLLRRVPVALGACWSEECSQIAAERIGAVLGWSAAETARELEMFERERAAFLQKPARARQTSSV